MTDVHRDGTDSAVDMQRLGYKATPPCFPYAEAVHRQLIAVPEGMLWSGKKNQPADLIQRAVASGAAQPAPAPAPHQGSTDSDHKPVVPPPMPTNDNPRDRQMGPPGPQVHVSNEQLLGLFDYRLDALEARLSTVENGMQDILDELRRGRSSVSLVPVDEQMAPLHGMISLPAAFSSTDLN